MKALTQDRYRDLVLTIKAGVSAANELREHSIVATYHNSFTLEGNRWFVQVQVPDHIIENWEENS